VTTVSNTPVPPKVVSPKSNITSDSVGGSAGYARPTAGGNATGQNTPAPAGVIPGPDAYRPHLPGNVDPNPTISGAAIVRPTSQPDATGHPAGDTSGGGTVGDSGPGLGQ
jgi:hypothetical protein